MKSSTRNWIIGVALLVVVVAGLSRLGQRVAAPPLLAPGRDVTPPSLRLTEDAEPASLCPPARGKVVKTYGSLELTVERSEDDVCRFGVRSMKGATLSPLAEDAGGLEITAQFADLDADAANELIVVADSGGSGLHADTLVFTQRPEPHLVEKYDGCATRLDKAPDGRRVLKTCTLSMNMMDGVCNGCSPRPNIYYLLEGGKLVQRNSLFTAAYDKYIEAEEKNIKNITPEQAEAFLASESMDDDAFYNSPMRDAVMRIAADYIYSGRAAKAKDVIDKYWPPWDRERILEDLVSHVPR